MLDSLTLPTKIKAKRLFSLNIFIYSSVRIRIFNGNQSHCMRLCTLSHLNETYIENNLIKWLVVNDAKTVN